MRHYLSQKCKNFHNFFILHEFNSPFCFCSLLLSQKHSQLFSPWHFCAPGPCLFSAIGHCCAGANHQKLHWPLVRNVRSKWYYSEDDALKKSHHCCHVFRVHFPKDYTKVKLVEYTVVRYQVRVAIFHRHWTTLSLSPIMAGAPSVAIDLTSYLSLIQHSHYCFINAFPPPLLCVDWGQAQHLFNKLHLCLVIKPLKHQQLSIVIGVSRLIHS